MPKPPVFEIMSPSEPSEPADPDPACLRVSGAACGANNELADSE